MNIEERSKLEKRAASEVAEVLGKYEGIFTMMEVFGVLDLVKFGMFETGAAEMRKDLERMGNTGVDVR